MEENVTYTLTYNANGGDGVPAVMTKMGNENFAIFTADVITPHRDGYVFAGWSFSPNAASDDTMLIHGGDYFTVTAKDATLFAVWSEATSADDIAATAVAEEGEAEPLGVFTSSSNDAEISGVSDAIGFAFIGAAIVLGMIALVLFRQKQPRILSKEEVED